MEKIIDLAVIGGGINGCGIAADAALRGLSVMLCEQDDLASKTSSQSSKLIHGGLRYLEHYDFSLVKKALIERQKLQELAPHLIHPLPFVLPHQKHLRPLWVLRLGLFLYDHLNPRNRLARSQSIHRKRQVAYFSPLKSTMSRGFLFYDCMTDDARLTLANALQAKKHGANILPQTKLVHAKAEDGHWALQLQTKSHSVFQVKAKVLINATGPWLSAVQNLVQEPMQYPLLLVKGSHLVIKKLYEGEHAYVLQHDDHRIVFTIPFHGQTLVGTTELVFSGEPQCVEIEKSEIDYLLMLINQYFQQQRKACDILTSWSGLRPLLAEIGKKPSTLSRDYVFHYSQQQAPFVSIYGGKISTYRQLACDVVDHLRIVFPQLKSSLTANTPLPGACFDAMSFADYQTYAKEKYSWLDEKILTHYLGHYGTLTEGLLKGRANMHDLGQAFTSLLYQAEVDYLLQEEWALDSDDILWRRTKFGLSIQAEEKKHLESYLMNLVG